MFFIQRSQFVANNVQLARKLYSRQMQGFPLFVGFSGLFGASAGSRRAHVTPRPEGVEKFAIIGMHGS
jgi:hypothetical protein